MLNVGTCFVKINSNLTNAMKTLTLIDLRTDCPVDRMTSVGLQDDVSRFT